MYDKKNNINRYLLILFDLCDKIRVTKINRKILRTINKFVTIKINLLNNIVNYVIKIIVNT